MINGIVFCDLDGTLLTSNLKITKQTKQTVKKLKDKNVEFVLTSGRSFRFVKNISNQLSDSDFVISSNGALIKNQKTNEILFLKSIPNKLVLKIFKLANKLECDAFIESTDVTFKNHEFETEVLSEIINTKQLKQILKTLPIIKFCIESYNKQALQTLIKKIQKFKEIKIAHMSNVLYDPLAPCSPNEKLFIDINNKDVAKGAAINFLIDYLKVDPKNVVSIGDSCNDFSMFKISGTDVAMGNSLNDLKKSADFVTKTNDESGVAVFLEKFFKLWFIILFFNLKFLVIILIF